MREERIPVRQAQGIFKNNFKNIVLGCKIMMMALNQFANEWKQVEMPHIFVIKT